MALEPVGPELIGEMIAELKAIIADMEKAKRRLEGKKAVVRMVPGQHRKTRIKAVLGLQEWIKYVGLQIDKHEDALNLDGPKISDYR